VTDAARQAASEPDYQLAESMRRSSHRWAPPSISLSASALGCRCVRSPCR